MKKRKLTSIISGALLWTAVFTAIITIALTTGILVKNAYEESSGMLKDNVTDIGKDISDKFMDNNIVTAQKLMQVILDDMYYLKRCPASEATDYLNALVGENECDEINVMDSDGIVVCSSNPDCIGRNINESERSSGFNVLLGNEKVYAQEPRRSVVEPDVMMAYAGAAFPDKSGFVQIGANMDTFEKAAVENFPASIRNRRIGEDGFLMVCNSHDILVLTDSSSRYIGRSFEDKREDIEKAEMNEDVFFFMIDDTPEMLYAREIYGYHLIGAYPLVSAARSSLDMLLVIFILEAVLFPLVFMIVYTVLRNKVIRQVERINRSLAEIAAGNLEEKADVRESVEFETLSDNINIIVDKLREASAREE
ncbi:MAG TPA: hypothetical protein DCL38_05955 [Lachnospiraceae bacterium]|nr:hypothetical protein [Lachnospiraceae bacterium]